jgi:foldase protein PrsA
MITPSAPGELAAKVNGQGILRSNYEGQVAQFQSAMVAQGVSFSGNEGKPLAMEVRRQVLESMIEEALIAQIAATRGITVTEQVLQQRVQDDITAGGGAEKFAQWLQRNNLTQDQYATLLRNQILTDELVRQLGTKIPDKVKQVHLRQILVDDEAKAKDLRKRLDGGTNFADLAKKSSMDEESRAEGGDRGFLPMGMGVIDPDIEKALAGAAPGQILGPIPSPFGFYLVQVMAIEDQRALTAEMRQGLLHDNFVAWLEEEKGKATIERLVKFE